jgi:hypothetical protein
MPARRKLSAPAVISSLVSPLRHPWTSVCDSAEIPVIMSHTLKERYFKYAHRCIDAAQKAATPEERMRFLEMARSWRSLAEKSDVIDGLVEEAKDMRLIPRSRK